MDDDGGAPRERSLRANQVPQDRSSTARDSARVSRSRSRDPSAAGLKDEASLVKVEKLAKRKMFQKSKMGYGIESDRRIPTKMPKHLFSGKRGNGKTDRR